MFVDTIQEIKKAETKGRMVYFPKQGVKLITCNIRHPKTGERCGKIALGKGTAEYHSPCCFDHWDTMKNNGFFPRPYRWVELLLRMLGNNRFIVTKENSNGDTKIALLILRQKE